MIQHKSRPLPCIMGLHTPAWVADVPALFEPADRLCVCAACGILLEGPGAGAVRHLRSPILTLVVGAAVGVVLARTHRSRR